MGFDTLLGNQRLKDNVTAAVRRGRLSHFYLLSGPQGAGKHTLARLLAAAALCREAEKPCLRCSACRKVMADTHPDFISVVDPDHKNVPVKLVREIRDDMFIRPNEGDRKIYMFPQELGIEGQNALLKVLEEPPSYGIFILLTDNAEKILPTVRSRCTELALQPIPQEQLLAALRTRFPDRDAQTLSAAAERSGGYLGQALSLIESDEEDPRTDAFLQSLLHRDTLALLQVLVPMERLKRDQLIPVLQQWAELLQQALVCRSGIQVLSDSARQLAEVRSSQELLAAIGCLQKAIEYTRGNVSPAAVCGYLEWALR